MFKVFFSIDPENIKMSSKYTTTNGRSGNVETIALVNVNGAPSRQSLCLTSMWKYQFCRSTTLNTLELLTFIKKSSELGIGNVLGMVFLFNKR